MTPSRSNVSFHLSPIVKGGLLLALTLLASAATGCATSGDGTGQVPFDSTVGATTNQPIKTYQVAPSTYRESRTASYTVDVTVLLNSTITGGENRVMVELRQGVPGTSSVTDTKYFEGQRATVSFWNLSAGPYFIAIGNGDSVAVGPVHQLREGQGLHTTVRVTQSSGNISTRSRSSL